MSRLQATTVACLIALLRGISAEPATAQAAPETRQQNDRSTPPLAGWLSPDHWTRHALQRLAASGLLPVDVAALTWPAPRAFVRQLLDQAAGGPPPDTETSVSRPGDEPDRRPTGNGSDRAIARAWLARFDAELRQHATGPLALGVLPAVGYFAAEGQLGAGTTTTLPKGPEYPGPFRINDVAGLFVENAFTAGIGPRFFLEATARAMAHEDVDWRRLAASTRIGPAHVWFGRREAAFGPRNGGLALSGDVPFDGAGLDTPGGFRLPGFLRSLGRVRVSQVVARFERSGPIEHPWFVATRLAFAPSDRLAIGINRAALFGGKGNEPVTLGRVLLVAIGITDSASKDSDFENQVASIDAAWHAARTVLVWAEYGIDDAGTAFALVPALSAGVLWTGPAWAPALSVGASATAIASSCCGHPAWYVHAGLADGWTDRGRLLGHPLGGNGLELSLDWAVDPVSLPVIARGRILFRDRGSENLFAPDLDGSTAGLDARVEAMVDRFLLGLRIASEFGDGPARWTLRFTTSLGL